MGVNSITLVGRAGRDPEVRYFESGSMVANLTMAVNRRSSNDEVFCRCSATFAFFPFAQCRSLG